MDTILHIVNRFLVHLFWGPGCLVGLFFVIATIARHVSWWPKLLRDPRWLFQLCALPIWIVVVLREPYDASHTDWWAKSWFDYLSWVPGLFAWWWGPRFVKLWHTLERWAQEVLK